MYTTYYNISSKKDPKDIMHEEEKHKLLSSSWGDSECR